MTDTSNTPVNNQAQTSVNNAPAANSNVQSAVPEAANSAPQTPVPEEKKGGGFWRVIGAIIFIGLLFLFFSNRNTNEDTSSQENATTTAQTVSFEGETVTVPGEDDVSVQINGNKTDEGYPVVSYDDGVNRGTFVIMSDFAAFLEDNSFVVPAAINNGGSGEEVYLVLFDEDFTQQDTYKLGHNVDMQTLVTEGMDVTVTYLALGKGQAASETPEDKIRLQLSVKNDGFEDPINLELFVVGPEYVDCVGVSEQQCLVVNGNNFYSDIDGFKYEEGNVYALEVGRTEIENPPADGGAYEYELVRIINEVSAELLAHNWQWVSSDVDGEAITPADSEQFKLVLTAVGYFAGTTDCNNISGSYVTDYSNFAFGNIASTRKFCENSQEHVYTAQLGEVKSYEIGEDGNLVFELADNSGEMVFAPLPKFDVGVFDNNWKWTGTEYTNGYKLNPIAQEAFVLKLEKDGSFGVTTDCNTNRGGYDATITGAMDFVEPFISTKKACPAISQESKFVKMMSDVTSYSFTDDGGIDFGLKDNTGTMHFVQQEQE